VLPPVEDTRSTVGFQLKETPGIDPKIALLAGSQRHLQLVRGMSLDRLVADQRNLGALRGVLLWHN
jgi:hypothetical protein